ncbi:MAG TPA: UDP-3-O-acyl-N-acetylglucosamine deacetylase [Alphaproteobacteria bacterium]|nr:UDP-3-O-[3-hydroxymyristoyl] N-acetylglucosamine deacetylase [Rhodospirillaceae bacterium]HRJ12592.1 UDP-3-O-acyl-N-acetylglucosamine deacetylase [Alphaproteobacteria bacterium]
MPFDAPVPPQYSLYRQQHSLAGDIILSGVGVHSGETADIRITPAPIDHGIVFIRSDLATDNTIPADFSNVTNTQLCTVIQNASGASIATIEHVMAALRGLGVDNAKISVSGSEVPILDGSAAPFIAAIDAVGIIEQAAPRRVLRILRDVRVGDDKSFASISPATHSEFEFQIDYPGTAIGSQKYDVRLINGNFRHDIAAARTFGLRSDVDQLRAMGFARGGSLENAIVVDGDEILNTDGLRFDDEFVRHKVLDAIGDLYLAGAPIMGRYHGHRAGHSLNNQLLRAVFADPANYVFETVASVVA